MDESYRLFFIAPSDPPQSASAMRLPRVLLLTLLVAAIAGPTLTRAIARAAVAPAGPA